MSRDDLYATDAHAIGPFEFDENVARVFPDMLQRSIPGYATSIQAIAALARRFVQPNTHCYDLGCSLGAASLAMQQNISAPGCHVIAVDNSQAMVSRCREVLALAEQQSTDITVIESDIQTVDIDKASMVVMNYTLQFLPIADRAAMIKKIADGMLENGILVLSEKVVDDDPAIEKILIELHHDFKRRNAYSDSEIERKRAAIENVLVPESVAIHEKRLRGAGFTSVAVWQRHFNFVSIVAIR